MEPDNLDKAFEALKTYDWGPARNDLNPIDEAIAAAQKDEAARAKLEARLLETLKSGVPRGAKDYIGRKLMQIGTAASVPALAELLPQEENSHMARYALERIPAPEAAQAMRDALPKVGGKLKAGVIGSLGVRRDAASVSALAALLGDGDPVVARAAATALGDIGTPEAAKALTGANPSDAAVKVGVVDGSFVCAELLLAAGKKGDALAVYKKYASGDQPKHVKLAATRGMLACAGK